MLIGLALFVVFLQPFFAMMRSNNWALILLAFTVALALHAVIFGPLAAFISEQFGTGSRYTGASMGYQLATLIGAGFTRPFGIAVRSFRGNIRDHRDVVPGRSGRHLRGCDYPDTRI